MVLEQRPAAPARGRCRSARGRRVPARRSQQRLHDRARRGAAERLRADRRHERHAAPGSQQPAAADRHHRRPGGHVLRACPGHQQLPRQPHVGGRLRPPGAHGQPAQLLRHRLPGYERDQRPHATVVRERRRLERPVGHLDGDLGRRHDRRRRPEPARQPGLLGRRLHQGRRLPQRRRLHAHPDQQRRRERLEPRLRPLRLRLHGRGPLGRWRSGLRLRSHVLRHAAPGLRQGRHGRRMDDEPGRHEPGRHDDVLQPVRHARHAVRARRRHARLHLGLAVRERVTERPVGPVRHRLTGQRRCRRGRSLRPADRPEVRVPPALVAAAERATSSRAPIGCRSRRPRWTPRAAASRSSTPR